MQGSDSVAIHRVCTSTSANALTSTASSRSLIAASVMRAGSNVNVKCARMALVSGLAAGGTVFWINTPGDRLDGRCGRRHARRLSCLGALRRGLGLGILSCLGHSCCAPGASRAGPASATIAAARQPTATRLTGELRRRVRAFGGALLRSRFLASLLGLPQQVESQSLPGAPRLIPARGFTAWADVRLRAHARRPCVVAALALPGQDVAGLREEGHAEMFTLNQRGKSTYDSRQ